MDQKMKDAIIEESASELTALLSEHMDAIDRSMNTALADFGGDGQFKYPVSLGLVITPYSREQVKVAAKISYSVKHSDETDGRMVDPLQGKLALEDRGVIGKPQDGAPLEILIDLNKYEAGQDYKPKKA